MHKLRVEHEENRPEHFGVEHTLTIAKITVMIYNRLRAGHSHSITESGGHMTATITELKILRRLRKEQDKEHISKIGRQVRVPLFYWLPPFLWIIPRIKFNRNAFKEGKVISESENRDGMEYTVIFQTSQPYWEIYPANAIEILPETKT